MKIFSLLNTVTFRVYYYYYRDDTVPKRVTKWHFIIIILAGERIFRILLERNLSTKLCLQISSAVLHVAFRIVSAFNSSYNLRAPQGASPSGTWRAWAKATKLGLRYILIYLWPLGNSGLINLS